MLLSYLYVCYALAATLDEAATLLEGAPRKYVANAGTADLRATTARLPSEFPYFLVPVQRSAALRPVQLLHPPRIRRRVGRVRRLHERLPRPRAVRPAHLPPPQVRTRRLVKSAVRGVSIPTCLGQREQQPVQALGSIWLVIHRPIHRPQCYSSGPSSRPQTRTLSRPSRWLTSIGGATAPQAGADLRREFVRADRLLPLCSNGSGGDPVRRSLTPELGVHPGPLPVRIRRCDHRQSRLSPGCRLAAGRSAGCPGGAPTPARATRRTAAGSSPARSRWPRQLWHPQAGDVVIPRWRARRRSPAPPARDPCRRPRTHRQRAPRPGRTAAPGGTTSTGTRTRHRR